MYKLILIEDNPIVRDIIIKHFNDSQRIECIFFTDSTERLLNFNLLKQNEVDIILLDILLPHKSGIEALPAIKKKFPDSEIIMYTIVEDSDKIFQAICNGATGYLLKNQTPQELEEELIKLLDEGGSLISPQVAKRIINYFSTNINKNQNMELTDIEQQIMLFLNDGLSYKEIAGKVALSVHGVRYHILNIYKKLEVNSKQQALKKFNFFKV